MKTIGRMQNTIQEYEWGSITAIPELMGKPPNGKPQAELWMGAHPKAPSRVKVGDQWVPLSELIDKQAAEMLGFNTAAKFQNQLPFLFKILAAGKPLSIQAHPNPQQAQEGYERENRLHIPLDAFNRNYKDSHHKPELICALTRFQALNGFRPVSEILSYLEFLCPAELPSEIQALRQNPSHDGLKVFFKDLMTLTAERKKTTVRKAVENARELSSHDPVFHWIVRLFEAYGMDMGLLSPALLNLVCLEPGEAMYLPAGRLHSYLDGTGIELMANSDNVLRGGCTPKHVDVPELLNVVDFETAEICRITPVLKSETEAVYPVSAEEFVLSVITVNDHDRCYISDMVRSMEILLCIHGSVEIRQENESPAEHTPIFLSGGESACVPANAGGYRVNGNGILYKASVP